MTTKSNLTPPMTTKGDFTQQIMDFRAAYLRAVARASVDLEFRKTLTQPGGDPLDVLLDAFGYECPWDLTLELRDDPLRGPRLNPAKGRVMTLKYWGEMLTVYLPKKPEDGGARLQVDALAAFYQLNPWFLRNWDSRQGKRRGSGALTMGAASPAADGSQPTVPNSKAPDFEQGQTGKSSEGTNPDQVNISEFRNRNDPPRIFEQKWSSVDVDKDRYDLGDDVNDFISLAAAIFNAVALGWENETLWDELLTYKGGEDEQRGRTISILKEWLGYEYPWDIDLIFEEDKGAKYECVKKEEGRPERWEWTNTRPPKLMLTLPWMSGVDPTNDRAAQAALTQARLDLANAGQRAAANDPAANKTVAQAAAAMNAAERAVTEAAAAREVKANNKNPGVAILGLALYNTDGAGYPFTCG